MPVAPPVSAVATGKRALHTHAVAALGLLAVTLTDAAAGASASGASVAGGEPRSARAVERRDDASPVVAARTPSAWGASAAEDGAGPARPEEKDAGAPAARDQIVEELTLTLDTLLARERPGGGWTFAHPRRRRVRPVTVPLRLAERIARHFGLATWDVVVLRSPGTPAAGLLLLDAHRLTGRDAYLAAARRSGDLLIALQLKSGGWLSEMPVEGDHLAWWFAATVRRCGIDDDVTPGAVRLLLALWERTGEPRYRVAAERGLALLLRAQLPEGAWPLVWRPSWKRAVWPTWEDLPTMNDAATSQTIETLLLGARVLARDDLLAAARRGGDWLVRAQLPPPQAGWAQQYDGDGQPAPARRYEPAAVASWESRHAVETLLTLAAVTGDRAYCEPVGPAVAWLGRSAVAPGCWARLYEMGTNEPVYVDERRHRVDSVSDAHRPYDWLGDFGITALLARAARQAGEVPPRPLPGDAGVCAGWKVPVFDPRTSTDPRQLIAHAGRLVAALEPPPASPCPPVAAARE